MYYLGIDIAKASFEVCLTHDEQQWRGEFANSASGYEKLGRWLKKRRVDELWACLEATGRYGEELTAWLHEQGYQVSVLNPQVSHHYAKTQMRRNKSDRIDAALLARYVAREEPLLWQPPPEAARVLQALTRRLSVLQESVTAETNRLQAGTHPPAVATSLQETIAFLRQQIEQVKAEIEQHIDDHPDLRQQRDLLTSIKGIGDHSAAIILGELPAVDRFDHVKQVTAFAGLTPGQLQSGQTRRDGGLVKMGSKQLRTALFLPALSAMRHNPLLKAFADRLRQRGKGKMTIVGAVMRKLLHLIYGVLKHQQPFDPYYLDNVQVTT